MSKFIKVQCSKCKNEQTIFGNATTEVKCLICNEQLSESRGGKAKIKAKIIEVLN